MRVLFVTNNYPTIEHPIFGIFVHEQKESLELKGLGVEVFFINAREGGKIAYIINFLLLLFKSFRHYDVVHCHHSFSALLFFACKPFFSGLKVLSYQNPPEKELPSNTLRRLLDIWFDRIIIKHNPQINQNKYVYLPNGVNTNVFKRYPRNVAVTKLKLNKEKQYILFLDSYNKRTQKRVDKFLLVIDLIKTKHKSVEPLILNNTDRRLIPYYMSASSIHLITSDFEGSPNSVKEAIVIGLPVVATPVGDIRIYENRGLNVYVTDSFEVEELALRCVDILDRQVLKSSKREILELEQSFVAQKLIDIYETV